jgi:hypothetical protein
MIPYILTPKWLGIFQQAVLSGVYGCILFMGWVSVNGWQSINVVKIVSTVFFAGALVSLFGVVLRRYLLEWIAIPLFVGGLLSSVIIDWKEVYWGPWWIATGFIFMITHRWLTCLKVVLDTHLSLSLEKQRER